MTYPVPEASEWYTYDSTKLQDYIDCPRAFFYKRILGWERERKITNDLVFGQAWHKALEYLYNHDFSEGSVNTAYHEAFLPIYRKEFVAATDELFDPKTPLQAFDALQQYVMHPNNRHDFDLLDILHTELAGVVPIAEGLEVVYKMDLVFRRKDNGKYGVLEHKSKKNSFTETWMNQWDQSIQIGTYNHALNMMLGDSELSNIEGVVVNGAAFLKTKKDFVRVEVHKPLVMMREWIWTVMEIIESMKLDLESLSMCKDTDPIMMAYRKNPTSCTKYYGCEFAPYCSAWPNPLQRCQTPPPGYIIKHWDPLAEEIGCERKDLPFREY